MSIWKATQVKVISWTNQVINIENDTLTYVAYTVLGEEYDRFTITKDFESGKKTLE